MAMEKAPGPMQLSFAMPEVGEQRYDPRIDDVRIVYPSDSGDGQFGIETRESAATVKAEEGVSLSLLKYYRNRKEMIQEAAAANSRRSWLPHTDTPEGFHEAYDRYGQDVFSVIESAKWNADAMQGMMDELFLVEELISAGFAAKAVRQASRNNTDAINQRFVGTDKGKARAKEYRKLDKKIEEHSEG